MANYILSILKADPIVIMSWGIDKINALPDDRGVSFVVNGFIYKGKVEIVYNEGSDLFDVKIGEETHTDIYFDELVSFIDREVEKGNSEDVYNKKINDWLFHNRVDIIAL